MKRKITWIGKAVLIVTAVFLTACDDGQLRLNQTDFSISPASPTIIRFDAEPNDVEMGGNTTITWEVLNATSIEISSKGDDGSSPLHVQTSEPSGSAVAQGITADTSFTLTATFTAPAEEEEEPLQEPKEISISAPYSPSSSGQLKQPDEGNTGGGELVPVTAPAAPATKTIKVTVNARSDLSASMTADKTNLIPGESTILRWSVTPEDAEIAIVDSNGVVVEPTFAGTDCSITDPSELLNIGTPVEFPQANGCAAVTPLDASTIYLLTARTDNSVGNADVEIRVNQDSISAEITVNGVKEAKVTNFRDPVEVSWIVNPANAVVSVVSNPSSAIVSCDPELPEGQVVEYTKSMCTLSGETEFVIRASMTADDTNYVEEVASVALGSVNAGLDIRGDEWGFVGEEVTLEIKAKEGIAPSTIKEVQITDRIAGIKRIPFPNANPIVKVSCPRLGVQVKMIDSSDQETDYGTRVRALTTIEEDVSSRAEAITDITFDPNDAKTRLVGVQMPGWNEGVARVYRNGADIDVGFGSLLKDFAGLADYWQDTVVDSQVKTFPVNAIAVRPMDSSQIFVGTSGAVVASDDGGETFELVAPALRISADGKNYDGSHPTCRGLEQTGVKASHEHQVVSLNQICDIAVGLNGRFIVATDDGAFSISNIDSFRSGDAGVKVVGHPTNKDSADSEGLLTYNHVVDDLECIDSDCNKIFAATDRGVLISENGGESWSEFGGLSSRAYKLVKLGEKLYAATENGVYESDVSSASWESMGLDYNTKSIAVDPNEGLFGRMLIASTDQGIMVTRDSGSSWSSIEAAGNEPSRDVAISTMNASDVDGKLITVILGSGKKALYGQTVVGLANDAPADYKTPEEEETPSDDEKKTPSDENTPGSDKGPLTDEDYVQAMIDAGADQAIIDALKIK